MRHRVFITAAALAVGACAPAAPAHAPAPAAGDHGGVRRAGTADVVLVGGKVFLATPDEEVAEAIALRGHRVLAVGGEAEIRALAGPDTEVIELAGGLVTPGFNDAHIHFASGGVSLLDVDLLGTRSLAEIEARVAAAAAATQPGEWIVGRGWDHTLLDRAELGPGGWPTRETLDRAAPENPVFLRRVDGHVAWVNTRALEGAGITGTTRPPPGGEIVRDPRTGDATGIFMETATQLIERRMPEPTPAQVHRGIQAALGLAARSGVTSVQTSATMLELQRYREMRRSDSLTVRVYAWLPLERETIDALQRTGVSPAHGDEWLRIGMLKGFTDGTLGSRTAYLLEPYADDPTTRGLPRYSDAELDSLVQAADAAGLQVLLHAIGDAANRQALDAFERAALHNGPRERRHRIEHAQILHPADVPRFHELGVIASMQPTHATTDMRWAEQRIGRERARQGGYVWRSLLDSGATLVFGTDFPVEPMPPVEGIFSAVTRQSRNEPGTPAGGWFPGQRLTRAEAIRLYTATAAFGEWEESRKGSLQPGMLADLVVWSADLLTIPEAEMLEARPVLTMVGGRTVYRGD